MDKIQIKLNSIKGNIFKNYFLTDDIVEIIGQKPSHTLYYSVRDCVIKKILDLQKENLLNRSFSFFCLTHYIQIDYDEIIQNKSLLNDYYRLSDLIPTYDSISDDQELIVVFSAMLAFNMQDVYIVSNTKDFFQKLTNDYISYWENIAKSECKELEIIE